MVPNEYSIYSLHTKSEQYDRYQARILAVRKILNGFRRHRIALSVFAVVVTGLVLCFLGMIGHFTGDARCSDFVYGEQPACSLKAFLSDVKYQYASVDGESTWSYEVPVLPGQYRIRAVSKNGFGVYRYSEEMVVTLRPRDLTIGIADSSYIYGDFSQKLVAACTKAEGLVPGDVLVDVQYRIEGTEVLGYHVVVLSVCIVNSVGEDVSASYALRTQSGTFTMLPRPITVSGNSFTKEYDGNIWDAAEASITTGTLAFHDRLQADFSTLPADVGSYTIQPACGIVDDQGKDVSDCYVITVESGTLTVLPRVITVQTGSAEKLYDEKPLTNPDWSVIGGEVVSGHSLTGHTTGSRAAAGESDNGVMLTVQDAFGADVSVNYRFVLQLGTLKVNPIVLKFQTDSAEKVYDGQFFRESGCRLLSGNVLPGHKLSYDMNTFAKNVGIYQNMPDVTVRNKYGKDVTAEGYVIEVDFGTLTVFKRPITITSESAEKLYDGRPLTCKEYIITEGTMPDIKIGEYINRGIFSGSQTEVGSSENTFYVEITDMYGSITNANYDITYIFGTLTVHENPDLPPDNGNDDSGGSNAGTGIGAHGQGISIGYPSNDDITVYAIISDVRNLKHATEVYFRDGSYCKYTGNGWSAPPKFAGFNGNNPLIYVGKSLIESGVKSSNMHIRLMNDCPTIVPYFPTGTNGIGTGSGESYFDDGKLAYEVYCCLGYSYQDIKDMQVRKYDIEREQKYRDYVYANYLQIPEDTKAALLAWAKENGLSANSATLVEDIQTAIMNAAFYNPNGKPYPKDVDVAVYFLTEAKEGICQHFATAATLMYRAFGIPARYTVGFVGSVKAGETTELTSGDAHAWVEIYVDGLGWVPMEVTGSNRPAEPKQDLYLQAYSATKYYDGETFRDYDLEHYTILSGELKDDHRLKVSFETAKYFLYPGERENRITECIVYDSQGRDVTDQYNIHTLNGTLRILRRKITIVTGSASKQYDGEPLTCNWYWIAEGSLVSGDRLILEMETSITDPGRVENVATKCEIWRKEPYLADKNITECYDIVLIIGCLEVIAQDGSVP